MFVQKTDLWPICFQKVVVINQLKLIFFVFFLLPDWLLGVLINPDFSDTLSWVNWSIRQVLSVWYAGWVPSTGIEDGNNCAPGLPNTSSLKLFLLKTHQLAQCMPWTVHTPLPWTVHTPLPWTVHTTLLLYKHLCHWFSQSVSLFLP